jgi:hypothetical protein
MWFGYFFLYSFIGCNLLIDIIKFIHLLCVLGLLGCILCCVRLVSRSRNVNFTILKSTLNRFNLSVLALSVIAMMTGTLLVYPKHFSFHTPWIQAAYLCLMVFCAGIGLLGIKLRKITMTLKSYSILNFSYLLFFMILLLIIHDAVTKTTLI